MHILRTVEIGRITNQLYNHLDSELLIDDDDISTLHPFILLLRCTSGRLVLFDLSCGNEANNVHISLIFRFIRIQKPFILIEWAIFCSFTFGSFASLVQELQLDTLFHFVYQQ